MITDHYGLASRHSRKASNEDQKGLSKQRIGIMHQLDAAECAFMPTHHYVESLENDLRFSSKSIGSGAHKESAFCYGVVDNLSGNQLTEESEELQSEMPPPIRVVRQHQRTHTVDSFGEIPLTVAGQGSQMHLISEYLHSSNGQMMAEETRNFGEGFVHSSIIFEERTTLENHSNCSDEPTPYSAPQQYVDLDARKQGFATSTQNLYESFHKEELEGEEAFKASQGGSVQEEKCDLLVWGSNHRGQLGLGDRLVGEVFRFPINLQFSQDVVKISCGQDHTALITRSKMLFVMGNNLHGQLGIGSVKQSEESDNAWTSVKQCSQPALVDAIAHLQTIDVSCGGKHTVCVVVETTSKQQSVFAWGDNSKGQLGLSETNQGAPTKVNFANGPLKDRLQQIKINRVSAGHEHTVFLDTQKHIVLACGESRFGQLGLGKQVQVVKTPSVIDVLSDKRICEISAGRNHTLALSQEGYVYAAGLNSSGQLGMGHQETLQMFMQVPKLRNILQISAGSYSGAIDQEGSLYVWGFWGTSHALTPRLLKPKRQTPFQKISVGDGFGVALDTRGRVFGWGSNELGQLGTSYSDTSKSHCDITEVKILRDKGIAQDVFAGQNFVIAKMHEVYATLTEGSQSLTHLTEARQKARFAKQVMQLGTKNQYVFTEQTEHSKVSPDFQKNDHQLSCSVPNLQITGYQHQSAQAKSIKTQPDFKDGSYQQSPKYMGHQPSITTTTSQYTQLAWNPTHIQEAHKSINQQKDLLRFELSELGADSRKFDISNGFQMRIQDDFQAATIQSDQQQTIKPYEQQEARIWDSFGQIREEPHPDHYAQSPQQMTPFHQNASLRQIVGARSKSTQATRPPPFPYEPLTRDQSEMRQSVGDQFTSKLDMNLEKQEQKECKRKQKELQRKFKQMQAEYYENKARREKELQNVYMRSYQGLALNQSNANCSLGDMSRVEKENNRSLQNQAQLDLSYQMPPVRKEDEERRHIKIYVQGDNQSQMRVEPRSKSAPRPIKLQKPESRPPLQQLQPVQQASQPYYKEPDQIYVAPNHVYCNIMTNTSVATDSVPNSSGRPTPNIWQRSPDDFRPPKKVYDQAYILKLRKKYKRAKMDQRNKNLKLQEQSSEIEHLRAIIDELKAQISTRKHAWQKKLKEREDRHNQETRKIRAEIAVLQEQVLTAERMCQHKESEAKAANQKLKDVGSQVQYVEADLRNLRDQVKRLQGQNDHLKHINDGLIKKEFEKDAHLRELRQHMDVRNMCISEAESTIKEQTKALQKMEGFLQEAQEQVEVKDESVKSYARQIEQLLQDQGNLQRQIESLKGFINELETTNLELMRFVDVSNQKAVAEYKHRASNILQGKRREDTASNNSMLDMTLQTSKIMDTRQVNSRSFSPMRSQEFAAQKRMTVDQRRFEMQDPPCMLVAQNFESITAQPEFKPAQRLEETLKSKADYLLTEMSHSQPDTNHSVKIETQQIVERAGKMLEKLFTMNKKLGNRALVPQIEAPQEVTVMNQQPLTVQNQRSQDFSRNFVKKSELTSPKNYMGVAVAADTRSKSYEESINNYQRSASQTSQVTGVGLQTATLFRSEPEMIFPSHTPQSYNSDKPGIGIRFKTQAVNQTVQATSQERADLNFRAINKRLMRQELESVNRSSLNL